MLSTIDQDITLYKIQSLFLENELTFVSYRLPYQGSITTMLQWKKEPVVISDIRALQGKSGFVFAPFASKPQTPLRLIEPDLVIHGNTFDEWVQYDSNHVENTSFPIIKWEDKHVTSRSDYMKQVEKIKQMIGSGKIDKVVLSRISTEARSKDFSPSELFNALHEAYPDAFVYLLNIPGTGTWCGASPEPLLQVNSEEATTVSLAGTRKFSEDLWEKPWGKKEMQEQQVVTTYIEDVLKKFHITGYEKSNPHTHRAGSIEHLRTVFSFPKEKLHDNLFEFINELHPTPSVCGLPKANAMDFINRYEKHDREYYTGFLGPLDIQNQWSLFVNLRCMKAGKEKLAFYLGAGITAGSDAAEEWDETESKKNTLQSIIKKITKQHQAK